MFFMVSAVSKDVEIQKQLTAVHVDEWLREDVFRFKWWILLGLILVFIIVWWIMLDKSRLLEICLYAALAIIVLMAINEYGEELTLWDYPVDIIAIFPPLSSINLISLPLIYSLVYQYFKTWKRFIWAAVITSAVICFIFEPILSWGGFFELLHWRYFLNFPLYAVTFICIRAVVILIYSIKENNTPTKRSGDTL